MLTRMEFISTVSFNIYIVSFMNHVHLNEGINETDAQTHIIVYSSDVVLPLLPHHNFEHLIRIHLWFLVFAMF